MVVTGAIHAAAVQILPLALWRAPISQRDGIVAPP
jgi:hypothetical protein